MEPSKPDPLSKALLQKLEDILFPMFGHAQCFISFNTGRGDQGRFGNLGFRGRDRDFRDHRRFFVGFDFGGFGFPYWWYPDNYYYGDYGYPYEDGSYDNAPVYDYRYWYGLATAV
jgi:hypothetical protein